VPCDLTDSPRGLRSSGELKGPLFLVSRGILNEKWMDWGGKGDVEKTETNVNI